ncbi:MAG: MFS transporter [Bacteroidota bacterium]|nr:MFS transporter [Bacteroidota bacterium]
MAENKLSQKQVLLMAVAGGVAVANIYYNQPILKDIQESAHVTESQAGAISFLSQAGYGLGLFFITPLGDKINRKKLTLILLLLLCIPLLVMAFMQNIYVLWAASFCIGLFSVAAQVILPLAASLDRVSTGSTVGKIFSGILIGILAARVLSGFVANYLGWHAVYMIACGLVLIIFILLYKYLPEGESNFSSNYLQLLKSTLLQVKRFSVLRISSAIGALMFGVFCSFWTNLTFHLSGKPFNYSPDQIGMFGVVAIGGALAAPLFGRSADKGKARHSLLIAMLLVFVSVTAMHFFSTSLIVLIAGIFILDVGVQAVQVTNVARIYSLDEKSNSRINTIYMTCYFIGGAGGTALGLYCWHVGGWSLSTWQMIAFNVIALIILLLNFKKSKSRKES